MNKDYEFIYGLNECNLGKEYALEVEYNGTTFKVQENWAGCRYLSRYEFLKEFPDLSFLVTEPEKFDEYGYYGENNGPLPMSNPGDKMYDV